MRYLIITLLLLTACSGEDMDCQIIEKKVTNNQAALCVSYSSCNKYDLQLTTIQNMTGLEIKVALVNSYYKDQNILFEDTLDPFQITKLDTRTFYVIDSQYPVYFYIYDIQDNLLGVLRPYL